MSVKTITTSIYVLKWDIFISVFLLYLNFTLAHMNDKGHLRLWKTKSIGQCDAVAKQVQRGFAKVNGLRMID